MSLYGSKKVNVLYAVPLIKIVDRDDRSDQEVIELAKKGIKVLSKRHLESYLLDDTVIKKLCHEVGEDEKYEECICKKEKAIENTVSQGKPADDIKSSRGEIYNALKQILGLNRCGNNADSFLRDTIAPLITPDMEIYQQLEHEIFG